MFSTSGCVEDRHRDAWARDRSTSHNQNSRERLERADFRWPAYGNSNTFRHERLCLRGLCPRFHFLLESSEGYFFAGFPPVPFYGIFERRRPWPLLLTHRRRSVFGHIHSHRLSRIRPFESDASGQGSR